MKMIVGLGNPTDKYAGTRHNLGFAVVDALADRLHVRMRDRRSRALCGSGRIGEERVLLVKPQTYMNASGESVGPLSRFYSMEVGDIILVYDDISLEVGQIRVRGRGSAGGHNGVKSVIAALGSSDFPRVRVGTGAPPPGGDQIRHVLGRFPKEELPVVRESIARAAGAVEMLVTDGLEKTMNQYNAFQRRTE